MQQTPLVFIVFNSFGNFLITAFNVVNVNFDEAFKREVFTCIRSTVIKRKGKSQEGIGKLFGPPVIAAMILDGNVVFVWVECISFVFDFTNPSTEAVELRKLLLELLNKNTTLFVKMRVSFIV